MAWAPSQLHRFPPRARALAVVVVAVTLAGCGGDRDTRPPPPLPTSTFTPLTTGPRQQELAGALLTAAEIQAIPDAPGGLTRRSTDPTAGPVGTDSDRVGGACGARSTVRLPPADRAIAIFDSDSGATVVHFVYKLAPGLASRFIAEQRTDIRPGCRPSRYDSPSGPEVIEFLGEVPLPPVGDERVGISFRTRLADSTDYYVVTAYVRSGTNLASISVIDAKPISQALPSGLLVAVARKLATLR